MFWIIVSGALFNFNSYAINLFMPSFLIRYHGLNLKDANLIAGLTLGAVWRARSARRRMDGRSFSQGQMGRPPADARDSPADFRACIFFALNLRPGKLGIFVALASVGSMLGYVYYSGVYAAVQDVVEPSLRGTAMALYFFAMYLLAEALGQCSRGS